MSFSHVCIVGASPIGCRVALACAGEDIPVSLLRAARADLVIVQKQIAARVARRVAGGSLDPIRAASLEQYITLTSDPAQASEADLVIDAASCDSRSRRAMLATLESRLSPGAVLATSAPAELLTEIADVLRRRDQFVGLRFSDASAADASVELAVLPETAPGVLAACRTFVARLGGVTHERASKPPRVGYREWVAA